MELNETKKTTDERATTNFAGGESFTPEDARLELTKLTINNLLENKYYEDDTDSLDRLTSAFDACASESETFPLKLAAYARQEMYLRDVPQVLLVLAANHTNCKNFVRQFAPEIIQRADEPCTVVATQIKLFGKPIPKPLKKGINDSLFQFDEYQFSKYMNENREVNLRDVINLCHPNPSGSPEHEDIFERLMKGDLDHHPEVQPLEPPETWEVRISEQGSSKEAWESIVDRMGLFAKIRNLRNMLEEDVNMKKVLGDDELEYVQNSKIYPFRFYQAYKAVKNAGFRNAHVEDWLSRAVEESSKNIDDVFDNSLVGVDVSGSMNSFLSNKSKTKYVDISALFGSVLFKKGADVQYFATDVGNVNPHHDAPVFSIIDKIKQNAGGGTNGWKVLQQATASQNSYDRIILLTDMQIWDSTVYGSGNSVRESFEQYRSSVNGDTNLYTVDLSSYGDLLTPEGYQGVYHIQGWNSKILDFIQNVEKTGKLVEDIQSFNLTEQK